jgi:electron transfer flavoprotein alpha subunit
MVRCLVFLEQRNGVIREPSLDLWRRVQQLAVPDDIDIAGFVAGPLDAGAAGELHGRGSISHAADAALAVPSSWPLSAMLADLVSKEGFTDIFIAATAFGRRLAPRLAASLRASLLAGRISGWPHEVVCHRHVYSGSVLASCFSSAPVRIFLQGREASPGMVVGEVRPEIIPFDASLYLGAGLYPLVRMVTESSNRQDIAEAGVIIAGGRGMGGSQGFLMLEELADLLHGSVGASRSAVDEGWRPHSEQIGQTGKSVAPDLYIACGISGAAQHLAGLTAARTVVAINTDQHAPVFAAADYGIVGDVHDVLPRLIDAVRGVLQKK